MELDGVGCNDTLNQEDHMKWIKTTCMAVALGVTTVGTLQAAPVIEKPVVMPEAMLSVTASDLHGLIDGIGSVAAQASPMMNGMMLKSMLGMQLGDPALAGIPPGKGLALVALDATNAFVVIEVAEAQSSAYVSAAVSKGMQAKYADGLLVVGKAAEQVEKGSSMAKAVQAALLARRSPTLRVAGQPASIVERNNERIQGFLETLPALMGPGMMKSPGATLESTQTTMKFLEGEVRVLVSIASQCDTGEIVVAPEKGSLKISEIFVPKAGTRLAALVDAPRVNQPNPKLHSGLLGDATMLLDCTLANPDALTAFFVAETEQLIKDMQLEVDDMAGLLDSMKKWVGVYGGTFCESVDFGGDKGFSVNYLMEVKDEKAALELFRTMEQDLDTFLKLYEGLGMSMAMAFKENVREYNGAKIHQFKVDMEMENMPPEQLEAFGKMGMSNMVYDVAIIDDVMFYAMGSTKIEDLIDAVKTAAPTASPLKAREVYPAEGFYYCDFDVGRYMGFITSLMPDGQAPMMQQMATMFKGVEPITSAGFKDDGRVMWSINVPGDLIAKYGQMAMMMQMQKMQQGGAPQGMPGGMPQGMPQETPQGLPSGMPGQ